MTTITSPPTTCAWIGNGEGCKHAAVPGRSYCSEHIWFVYKEGSAQGKRKKDAKIAAAVWDLESEFNSAVEELEAEGFDVFGDSERSEAVPD